MESTPTELVNGRIFHGPKGAPIAIPTAPHQLSALEFAAGEQHEPDTEVSISELKTLVRTLRSVAMPLR